MDTKILGPKPQAIVNDCYILQHRIKEDAFAEYWHATAIFSAQGFLLRFLKFRPSEDSGAVHQLWTDFYSQALKSISIRHPSLLPSLEVERYLGQIYLAYDSSDMKCLAELAGSGQKFSLLHICLFGIELARGLEVWKDQAGAYLLLNPEVVWVRLTLAKPQQIQLLNPGYALLLSTLDDSIRLKQSAFLAPEAKIAGAGDFRSDIGSLGILLFWLLTGELPFSDPDNPQINQGKVSMLYAVLMLRTHDVPDSMMRIVLTMLRTDPQNRYDSWQSAIECLSILVRDLQANNSGLIDNLATRAGFISSFTQSLPLSTKPLSQNLYPTPGQDQTWEATLATYFAPDNPTFSVDKILEFAERADLLTPSARTITDWKQTRSQGVAPSFKPKPDLADAEAPTIRAYTAPTIVDEARSSSEGATPWFSEMGSVNLVLNRLAEDWRQAAINQGSLRFVEEPRHPGPIHNFLMRLRNKALYLEVPQRVTSAQAFLEYLKSGWERSGSDRSPTYLKRLRQRIRSATKIGAFESPVDETLAMLSILGTRATPLVVVIHHAQGLGREMHDLLISLRERAAGASFCIFAFFDNVQVPDWHVLHQLTQIASPHAINSSHGTS